MKARRLPRGVYRRGNVLWIRFKSADGKLTRESTGQRDVKVAESIPHAGLSIPAARVPPF